MHRPAYLDYVGVKRFDASGEVVGERRFLGLYTHTAYSASPWEIPVLRRKAQRVVERSGLPPGSHDHKALVDILETYPRDELFQISEDELLRDRARHSSPRRAPARTALRAAGRVRTLPVLPRLRAARARSTPRTGGGSRRSSRRRSTGTSVDYTTRVSESVLARLHFVVYTAARARFRSTTSPRSRRRLAAVDALLERTTCATRSPSSSARRAPARSSSATARRSRPRTGRTSPPARRCSTSSGSSGSTRTATSG